ncbi:MAG: choice-of-anchor V domain-containing protein [Candidatus Hodarchaeota archaeon]
MRISLDFDHCAGIVFLRRIFRFFLNLNEVFDIIPTSRFLRSDLWNKKRIIKFFAFAAILLVVILSVGSLSNGFDTGTDLQCFTCHGPAGDTVTIEMSGLPSDTYVPDTTYNISLYISDSILNSGRGGVYITADKGILSSNDPNLQKIGDGLAQLSSVAVAWTFSWTAPSAGSGDATMTVYALLINGDATASGDSGTQTEINLKAGEPATTTTTTTGSEPLPAVNYGGEVIILSIIGAIGFLVLSGFVVAVDFINRRKQE